MRIFIVAAVVALTPPSAAAVEHTLHQIIVEVTGNGGEESLLLTHTADTSAPDVFSIDGGEDVALTRFLSEGSKEVGTVTLERGAVVGTTAGGLLVRVVSLVWKVMETPTSTPTACGAVLTFADGAHHTYLRSGEKAMLTPPSFESAYEACLLAAALPRALTKGGEVSGVPLVAGADVLSYTVPYPVPREDVAVSVGAMSAVSLYSVLCGGVVHFQRHFSAKGGGGSEPAMDVVSLSSKILPVDAGACDAVFVPTFVVSIFVAGAGDATNVTVHPKPPADSAIATPDTLHCALQRQSGASLFQAQCPYPPEQVYSVQVETSTKDAVRVRLQVRDVWVPVYACSDTLCAEVRAGTRTVRESGSTGWYSRGADVAGGAFVPLLPWNVTAPPAFVEGDAVGDAVAPRGHILMVHTAYRNASQQGRPQQYEVTLLNSTDMVNAQRCVLGYTGVAVGRVALVSTACDFSVAESEAVTFAPIGFAGDALQLVSLLVPEMDGIHEDLQSRYCGQGTGGLGEFDVEGGVLPVFEHLPYNSTQPHTMFTKAGYNVTLYLDTASKGSLDTFTFKLLSSEGPECTFPDIVSPLPYSSVSMHAVCRFGLHKASLLSFELSSHNTSSINERFTLSDNLPALSGWSLSAPRVLGVDGVQCALPPRIGVSIFIPANGSAADIFLDGLVQTPSSTAAAALELRLLGEGHLPCTFNMTVATATEQCVTQHTGHYGDAALALCSAGTVHNVTFAPEGCEGWEVSALGLGSEVLHTVVEVLSADHVAYEYSHSAPLEQAVTFHTPAATVYRSEHRTPPRETAPPLTQAPATRAPDTDMPTLSPPTATPTSHVPDTLAPPQMLSTDAPSEATSFVWLYVCGAVVLVVGAVVLVCCCCTYEVLVSGDELLEEQFCPPEEPAINPLQRVDSAASDVFVVQ